MKLEEQAQRRARRDWRAFLFCLLVLLTKVVSATSVAAHWIPPEQIVATLQRDEGLRNRVGVRGAERQGRLLIIRIDAKPWGALPAEQRRELAEQWYRIWRHNVEQGIVAVVAIPDDAPLVNYDASGNAHLLELPAPRPIE